MSRIETLTPEQIARFPEFCNRWTEIGLCTESADRPRAEAAIREIYRQGGLEPPAKIVWCGSPLSLALTRAIILEQKLMPSIGGGVWNSVNSVGLSVRASLEGSVGESVWNSVWKNVRDSVAEKTNLDVVWDSVADIVGATLGAGCEVSAMVEGSIWNSVGDSVRATVGESVWTRVGDNIRHSVWDSVGDGVWECVWNSVRDGENDYVYGADGASWHGFCRYFQEVMGLTAQTAKLSGRCELARSAGWALPHQNICWVSERPHILLRDDHGRLHGESGPAVAYPDGWKIHAVHGVRVHRDIVEDPRQIDIAWIDAEPNAEVRRVMIDRYRHGEEVSGAAAFIRDAGSERLDHDERFGTLWRRNVPDDEPIVMIEVANSTLEPDGRRKRYWLRVPPNMTTAHEAVAWTFNLPARDYAPKVET